MAKITRKHQKIFASTAGGTGVAAYGSVAGGSVVYSTDPDVLQTTAFENGIASGIIAGTKRLPVYEEENGIFNVATRQLAYLFQEGVPEYDVATEYQVNSVVKKASTYELYGSLINVNIGNALGVQADTANWKYLGKLEDLKNAGSAGNLTGAITSVGLATSLGGFTSANLAAALTDETGTGANVFAVSPSLTGSPTAPTQSAGDNSTKIATTAYADAAASAIGSGRLLAVNNLSDLGTLATALTNLGFVTSAAGNGYVKLPGGIIIQWGTIIGNTAPTTITLPTAFTTAMYTAVVCGGSAPAVNAWQAQAYSFTTTNFVAGCPSTAGAAFTYNWIAIGK